VLWEGRLVAAAAGKNLAGVVMELGGKAPMLLFEDADIEQAVNTCTFASFIASGRGCLLSVVC
jgi:acyl-CoA reductase-like NAD-dependent aldehyde dehydrogenase